MRMVVAFKILLVLLTATYVFSLNGPLHYMLDNLASFKVHFAISFLVCAIVLWAMKSTQWAMFASFVFLAPMGSIIPWYLPANGTLTSASDPNVKLLSANVSPRNDTPELLVALIEEERPDVVGLIELNPDYASGLQKVRNLYPYFYEVPELGFWGLGLYSKYPLRSSNLVSFGEHLPATIIAEIDFPQARFDVILVHPFPPMNAGLAADRNHHLDKIASYIAASGRSTIVLTDMNTAMWSHYHEKFVAHSGLRNARQGFGVASTWPPNKYLGVPIDHVFHSADTVVRNFRVLRSIGSDHLPIIAKIIIKHADSHNRTASVFR